MKFFSAGILLLIMTCYTGGYINAQENSNSSLKVLRNNINIYCGLMDYNINYERNIIQRPKSYSNLRIGIGGLYSNFDGEYYFNPSFVHLIGKKNRHLEFDLGLKFIALNDSSNLYILPDIFAGYRYEKPSGGLIFRVGINLFTLFNIGIGIKF